jgi:hypothetical protein
MYQTDKPDGVARQGVLKWVKDIAKLSDSNYGNRRIQKVLNAAITSETKENSTIDERSRRVGAV